MAVRPKPERSPMDRSEIRQRAEAASRATAEETAASPEHAREVLEERARALARPAARAQAGDAVEVITFTLADETYAIESRYVLAVFRLAELSRLPGAAPPVFGVTAWRGELLTILDLRPLLGLSVVALNDLSRVIVLGEDRPAFGILADAVQDLVTLPAAELRALPEGVAAQREFLRAVTANATLVLDGERLLRGYG